MSLDTLQSQDIYILEYLQALDCPRSLAIWLMYTYGEHDQLASFPCDPHSYNTMNDFRDSLAATKFLSKASFLKTSYNLEEVAMDKFFDSEQVCHLTNRRIYQCKYENPCTPAVIMTAARKIDRILGSFEADEFVDSCDWGPGATTSIGRRFATSPNKFDLESRISADAYDFVHPWFRAAYPHWECKFEINGSSKIVTVPKDAKSHRTIAIEPGINLWFQKGIGKMIRRRLSRSGIDLSSQEHNQRRSRLGSVSGHLATVDFSSASDTISRAVVEELLPRRWFVVCDALRSKFGTTNKGEKIFFEKFSSMGNGFTFELETLIFYSIALAVCEIKGQNPSGISVFGDDVVIPVGVFDIYSSVCADLGFRVNRSKSYSSSYYRESCGSHYWYGVDVKPIFQKDPLYDKTSILKAANNVRRLSHRHAVFGCDSRFLRCWGFLAGILGPKCPRISDGYGDIGLIENIDGPHVTARRAKYGHEGYFVNVYGVFAVKKHFDSEGLRLAKLKQIGSRSPKIDFLSGVIEDAAGGNLIPLPLRTRTSRMRLRVPRWHDLGPWF